MHTQKASFAWLWYCLIASDACVCERENEKEREKRIKWKNRNRKDNKEITKLAVHMYRNKVFIRPIFIDIATNHTDHVCKKNTQIVSRWLPTFIRPGSPGGLKKKTVCIDRSVLHLLVVLYHAKNTWQMHRQTIRNVFVRWKTKNLTTKTSSHWNEYGLIFIYIDPFQQQFSAIS